MEGKEMFVASFVFLFVLKILLFPSYSSTDLEVHRNWMAIVHQKPLAEWYTEDTSEWTLDYPPLFAYFEKVLSIAAVRLGMEDILSLQKEPLQTRRVFLFQRTSVLLADIFYVLACYVLMPRGNGWKSKVAGMCSSLLLLTHSSFLLLDNIHFQYNAFLTSFLIFSIVAIVHKKFLLGGFFFSVLINFKHIYIYYAPAYVFYYLSTYFWLGDIEGGLNKAVLSLKRGAQLGFAVVTPFLISLAPLLYAGGLPALLSLLSRLFPIQRGLTHSFWAPNFWALYNTLDLVLCKLAKAGGFDPLPPQYTSGIVKEYAHSVLPNMSVRGSLCAVTLFLLPLFSLLFYNSIWPFPPLRSSRSSLQKTSMLSNFSFALLISSLAFFFFGYHVHEKAIILPLIPLIILAAQNAYFAPLLVDITVIASCTLSTLLFTTQEIPLRISLMVTQLGLTVLMCVRVHSLPLSTLIPPLRRSLIILAFFLELYQSVFHQILFGDMLPFVPLLCISVLHAMWLGVVYARLLLLAVPPLSLSLGKILLKRKEKTQHALKEIKEEAELVYVAGVDMAICTEDVTLAVASVAVYDYSTAELLMEKSEVVIVRWPYVPHFLALQEAELLSRLLNSVKQLYHPLLVYCDGNGRFHPRGFGLACHVSTSTGLPSVGVAKNIDYGLVKEEDRRTFEQLLDQVMKKNGEAIGRTPFDVLEPVRMEVVWSPSPLFVSVGDGVSLEVASSSLLHLIAQGVLPTLQRAYCEIRVRNDVMRKVMDPVFSTNPFRRRIKLITLREDSSEKHELRSCISVLSRNHPLPA